jgi:hypothetical protein
MAQSKRWLPALDDQPGPAPSISEARASALVDGALDRAFAPAVRPVRRRFSTRLAFAMAATLVVAGAAAAVFTRKPHAPAPVPSAPAPPAALGPAALEALAPHAAPSSPAPSLAAPAPSVSSTAPPHATRAPSADSADLLARANELRAARRWKDAAQAYERVLSVHASSPAPSPEAYAAQVAAADLHLDQLRDPRGALRLYRGARGGPLAEQVLWGIARSTRALGDAPAEQVALRDYVAGYPAGLFASDARKRLAELGATP